MAEKYMAELNSISFRKLLMILNVFRAQKGASFASLLTLFLHIEIPRVKLFDSNVAVL
jgi:hypothetical protein